MDANMRPRKFLIKNINETLQRLLESEDTDQNCQITIDDDGPKVLSLGTHNSNGFATSQVRGTYALSNLLQELTIAKNKGKTLVVLDEDQLNENPVDRLARLISGSFWANLSREITKDNILDMTFDEKILEDHYDGDGNLERAGSHRLYIPYNRADQYEYFSSIKAKNPDIPLHVEYLPEVLDAEFIMSANKKPGLLILGSKECPSDSSNLLNEPYVVPGGRFNEFYGWDSYIIVLGLLLDVTPENQRNLELSLGMTENFIYEINHYHKILNANRSYFLGRSQPPFLTDMAIKVHAKMLEVGTSKAKADDFLRRSILAAIKEYNTVWCSKPRLNEETGLSCYHPEGKGVPPETEESHFDAVLKKYVERHGVSQAEFIEKYNHGEIKEPELDEYFLHDRAVRESGHDTSYRLEGKAAYLATVDLNSLLYKYEADIEMALRQHFGGSLEDPATGTIHRADTWKSLAIKRKANISRYLWNEQDSMFYDYHIKKHAQERFESATCFWPLWSGAASEEQAAKLVKNSLSKLEEHGGLVSGSLESRGAVGIDRPSRQWDYPFGWAPHQILVWQGLKNYGYVSTARRLVYRWLYMMTRAFVDFNGVVVEKYNVLDVAAPHKVDAEYGNQGTDFKGVASEGFGWVNSSYLLGLTYLDQRAKRSIGVLIPPEKFLAKLGQDQRHLYYD